MGYLNTSSGLTPFLDSLTQQLNQAGQQNAQTRALIEAGGLPPSALPDGYLGRLQAALMPGSQPLQLPTAPTPAPAAPPGVLGAVQGGNAPQMGQQPPMQPLAPPSAPVASAAPPPVMRQPAQPSAGQVPSMDVQGLPSMAAMQGNAPVANGMGGMFSGVENKFGLPAGYLAQTASIESGGNPNATSPTGAKGLFQFTKGTAAQYGLSNPNDPVASTYAAGRLAADNAKVLTEALGRPPTAGELYLAHQQGAGTAAALLANPDKPAGQVLQSLGVSPRNVTVNGGDPNMPAGQFAGMWTSKFGAPGNIGGAPIGAPATQVAAGGGGQGGSPAPLRGAPASPFGGLDRTAFGGAPAVPGAAQVPTFAQTGLGQAIASNGGNLAPAGQAGFSAPMPVATAGPSATVQGQASAFAGQPAAAPAAAAISTATGSYGAAPLMVNGKMMTRAQAEASPGTDHTDYDDAAAKAGLIPSADAAPVFTEGGTAASAAPAVAAANVASSYAPGASTAPGTANAGNRLAPVQQPPAAPQASVAPDNNGGFGARGGGFSVQQIQALMRNPATRDEGFKLWQQYLTPHDPYKLSPGEVEFNGQNQQIASVPANESTTDSANVKDYKYYLSGLPPGQAPLPFDKWSSDRRAGGSHAHVVQNALVDDSGKVLYQGTAPQGMDPETVDSLARRVLLGDTTALVGLSRGAQGSANIAAVQKRVHELAQENQGKDKPIYPESDILKNRADVMGDQAGAKASGTLTAKMDTFANEASQSIDLATTASRQVPRTTWTPVNTVSQDYGRMSNDPKLASFVAANNAVVNTYAKAINPSGVPTDSDKAHAREVLNTAQSPEAYEAVLQQLQREVNIAHNSARNARAAERNGTASNMIPVDPSGTAPGSKSVGVSEMFSPADAASAVKVASPADAAKLPPGTIISMPDGRLGKVPAPKVDGAP